MLRALGLALAAALLAGCAARAPERHGLAAGQDRPPAASVSQGKARTGTGFFVSAQGHLVTALHVVRGQDLAQVRLPGQTGLAPAVVLKRDERNDLALLKVEARTRALGVARWDAVPMGLEAYVVGYPLPELQGATVKITDGIVNGTAGGARASWLFQLSAEVQRGNSGGPVLSPDGLVMGVVQGKLDAMTVAQRTRDLPQNVNYAVNSRALADFLADTDAGAQVHEPRLAVRLRPYEILRLSLPSVAMVLIPEAATPMAATSP